MMAVAVSAAVSLSFDAFAGKPGKKRPVLDGSVVSVGRPAPAVSTEQKLNQLSVPGIVYEPDRTVYLYPLGQDKDQGIVEDGVAVTGGPVVSTGDVGPEKVTEAGFIWNVSDSARIDLYIPERCNGQMVIACPGGGYEALSTWNEGSYMAKWCNDRNIACAVLKYRMPHAHREAPLADVQNAFRYCRHHAGEWGVRQIGVAGFSAGGHLAASAQTMYVDSLTRPDFAILFYPVITMFKGTDAGTRDRLLGTEKEWTSREGLTHDQWWSRKSEYESLLEKYSLQNSVTPQTCPTFLVLSSDDKIVHPSNSVAYYRRLVACKVPSELHIMPIGGHGCGFTDPGIGLDMSVCRDGLGICRAELVSELERWLTERRMAYSDERIELYSGPKAKFSHLPDTTVLLYPEGQNVDRGIVENGITVTLGPCQSNGCTKAELVEAGSRLKYTGDSARFDLYLAKNPNGKMVVVCPGGAYWFTSVKSEGAYVADWLNSQGVSVAVVKYRLPFGRWMTPITDVQNTMRYCRHHAAEWGIDKIGVMGFSAGGHLAATASTMYVDFQTRPDFSILVYPVISSEPGVTHQDSMNNLIGTRGGWTKRADAKAEGTESSFEAWRSNSARYEELLEQFSLDRQVTPDTPETFIIFSSDDPGVPPENECRYFDSLMRCGVKCEMHALPGGGHGYGFLNLRFDNDPLGIYRADFLKAIGRYLENIQ